MIRLVVCRHCGANLIDLRSAHCDRCGHEAEQSPSWCRCEQCVRWLTPAPGQQPLPGWPL